MRVVLVSFEVSVSQSSKPIIKAGAPDFVFKGEFDKDSEPSFSAMCDLEYKVEGLAKSFKALGYQVSVLRKEVSHLSF